ncbi:MAG: hypothetical protein FJX75_25255 [Armatimonadetes bacterium]|nr:hypothetical protein [Armatimonadota bacterium]
MRVFFAYDNEDWVTPETDDIVKRLAELHEEHGLVASFYTVAERARALRRRGRKDVIDALARHEISYHNDTHGHFPRPQAVYCEELGWEAGLAELLRIEARGVQDVATIFDQFPVTWCQGECNWAPQAVHALRQLGIGSWTGSLYGTPDGMPVWYMGQLCVRRAMHVVPVQPESADEDLFARFTREFEQRLEEKGGEGFIYVFGHPCRWGAETWWGQEQWDDYRAGRTTEPHQLRPPSKLYTPAQVERLMQETDRCLEWVASRSDLTPTTYAEVNAACEEPAMQWLALEDLLDIAIQIAEQLTYVTLDETTLSPADALAALVWMLSRPDAGDGTPIPLRRPLGPLSEPHALSERTIVPVPVTYAAYRLVDEAIERTGALPAKVTVNGLDLGPADVLRLAVHELTAAEQESWSLSPGPALPAIVEAQCFRETRFNSWSYPEGFEPTFLANLARWQSWTFRPALMRW